MSDLPEINFKEKKDNKKGFLPWLRSHLGFGGRGAMGGAGEALPGAANLGRAAFGAARFGASSAGGIGGLLAGKAGLILTTLIVSAAIGTSLYMKNQPEPGVSTGAFSSNKTPDTYVPAILRQNQSPGSSLDMFKDTNKGSLGMDAPAVPAEEAKDSSKDGAAKEEKPAVDPNAPAPGGGVQDMMGKLAGGSFGNGGLSNSMGSGGSKFSNMGGFGNKFNSGAAGAKSPGFGSVGAGFQNSSKFDARKKLLAMKGSKTPVFSKSKGAKGAFGKGSLGQAKGLKSMQKSYSGKEIDSLAGTQNKAWTGSTAEGDATGGTGLTSGDGGAGVVTSPSVDNTNTSGGGDTPDPTITDPGNNGEDVSPWKGLPEKAMMYIMLSAVLSVIAAALVKAGKKMMLVVYTEVPGMILYGIGIALAACAAALAVMAIAIGIQLMGFGQGMLGAIYTLGGGVALVAAAAAVWGSISTALGVSVAWMAAIAGILAMLGSMAG